MEVLRVAVVEPTKFPLRFPPGIFNALPRDLGMRFICCVSLLTPTLLLELLLRGLMPFASNARLQFSLSVSAHHLLHLPHVGAAKLHPQLEARDVVGGNEAVAEHTHPSASVNVACCAARELGNLVASQLPLPLLGRVRCNQDAGIGFFGIVVVDPDVGHVLATVRLVAVCAKDDGGRFSSELPDIPHAAVEEEGVGAV